MGELPSSMFKPLQQFRFEADRLMQEHPPRWNHACKRLVASISCPPGAVHRGTLRYSRWAPRPLPARIAAPGPELAAPRPGYYDYQPFTNTAGSMEWHVNFADPDLFVAYGSSLLAQDEMQAAEHPAIGALRESLDDARFPARTRDDTGPTPILISGVERRCRIVTEPNAAEGRPLGLYGNRFAQASDEVIRKAVTPIEPPTITNFIAIAAPSGGVGPYTAAPIKYSLTAAFTGFQAAVEQTRSENASAETIVHSGFWGCGAFGGNRTLMTMIQLLAASAAGVGKLVFHTGDAAGLRSVAEAQDHLQEIFFTPSISPTELIQHLVDRRYLWGESDGN